MLSILKSMAWVRWRIFVNTLNKPGGRDAMQRTALALERLAPIALTVILVPSAIALGAYGAFAGYQLVRAPQQPIWFELPRILLLVGTMAALIGPILMPMGDRTNPVRFLLLPIPPRALYASHLAGSLGDPWIFLQMPLLATVPLGLLAAGAVQAAVIAFIAGLLLLVVLIGVASAMTTLIHLVLRDRRRGEVIALLLIVIVPLIGLLPSMMRGERRDRRSPPPQWIVSIAKQGFSLMPSEIYVAAVRHAPARGPNAAAIPIAGLAGFAVLVQACGVLLFRRVLSSTETTGPRRATSMRALWNRRIPGTSPGTTAVTFALLRLALRTPRGRATLLAPLAFSVVFAAIMLRTGSFDASPFPPMRSAPTFAMFAAFLALVASIPISMNQFAVDRAGLTMTLLAPLSPRQILAGKAIGAALIAVVPGLLCVALIAAAFAVGSPALWLSLAISVVAISVLVAPIASLLSILLPRVVDMNSVGSASNAHQLAGLGGMLAIGMAALPCAALTLLAMRVLDRPALAPVLLLAWCLVAFVLARLLFRPVEKLFEARRENLAMLM